MEANPVYRNDIAEYMEIPPKNFAPEFMPYSASEQAMNYYKLLMHILCEVESFGFEVGVLVCGHYPLIDCASSVVSQFNQRRLQKFDGMIAWAFCDYLLLEDQYHSPGDHAGGWETSHMMALHPDTVNLDILPPKDEPVMGTMWNIDPRDSTSEFGWETIDKAVDVVVREVKDRVENLNRYLGHGKAFRQGLWRGDS
jgi:creatinine amidohydrolase